MKTIGILTCLFCSIFLFSCNSNNFDKEAVSTAPDSLSVTGLTGDSVKLVKTAHLDFEVNDVYESIKGIVNITRNMGGVVTKRHMESVNEQSKRLKIKDDSVQVVTSYLVKAEMLVRIPSEKLDDFIEQTADGASFINSIDLEIEDKSLQYLAYNIKQQNREELLKDEAKKEHKTEEAIDLLNQKDQVTDKQITNRQTDIDASYSTVQLTFVQNALIKTETIADNNLSHYQLPFTRGINNAFFTGWDYFLRFIIGVVHLWMFIVAGIGLIILLRYYKARKATFSK